MFHLWGPLACSTDWFLNGVSCYKENNKDTWQGAQQGCTASGGDLVKVDDDNQKRFLIHFMELTGLKKTNIEVSIKSLTLWASWSHDQHEIIYVILMRYKT